MPCAVVGPYAPSLCPTYLRWILRVVVGPYASSLSPTLRRDSLSLVSIRRSWSRFALVGFESPQLVSLSSVSSSSRLSSSCSSHPSSSSFSFRPSSLASHPSSVSPLLFFIVSSPSSFLCPSPPPCRRRFLASSSLCRVSSMSPLIFVASGSHLVLVARSEASVREG